MTPLALLFMVTAVGGVTLLCGWCYYRVLSSSESDAGSPPSEPDSAD